MMDAEFEKNLLNTEYRQLHEQAAAIRIKEQDQKEEQVKLEQLSLQLEQEKAKVRTIFSFL